MDKERLARKLAGVIVEAMGKTAGGRTDWFTYETAETVETDRAENSSTWRYDECKLTKRLGEHEAGKKFTAIEVTIGDEEGFFGSVVLMGEDGDVDILSIGFTVR